jgi:peptidoglycan hydrolase-like protein with peptidoglycan-binding domain
MKTRRTLGLALVAALTLASAAMADEQSAASKEKAPTSGAKTTTSTQHHTGKPVQHVHLSKDEVTAVQNALAKSGQFKGTADGVMNKDTEDALRVYQKENGLKVTGVADTETLKKLGVEHHPTTTSSAHKTTTQSSMSPSTPAGDKK